MKANQSKTVLFVTGAFVSHLGWRPWQQYFEQLGYTTYAPSWPNKNGTPQELRNKRPNDIALAKTTITDVVNSYADFIQTLPEKPIIIGHSFGGLVTQILLDRGLAAAAIAVHSVPPFGVIPFEFSFTKAAWRSLGLFTSLDKTYLMSFETWQYAFTNGMSLADQQKAYDENIIPESKRVARGGLTLAASVSFKKEHAPLLFIAGGKDNIIPASLNKRNFNSYKNKNAVTDFKQFDENNHFVVSLPNWKNTAEYIYNWIQQQ
ncbi:MAG: alpha/beta hydrolase [Sphingobacteriales bacterium]|nr:MAG: alpha/beta hydrolase [Sphingobacteriales bacterium]